jgi:8-oxo-dGTP diphosphatase
MPSRKKKYSYDYPRASVTVDVAVITRESQFRVLLIRRKHDPFAGTWALPGGFIDMDETLEASARRELREETGLEVSDLEQLQTFGDPGRDPRGRTVSVVYLARIDVPPDHLAAADDAAELAWHPLHALPHLAFDHGAILALARWRVSLLPRKASRSRER